VGFQVVISSRFTNEAGGIKELYYSQRGMLNLDTNKGNASRRTDRKRSKGHEHEG